MLDERYERYEGLIRDAASEISQSDTEADDVNYEKVCELFAMTNISHTRQVTLILSVHKDKIAVAYFDTLTHKIYVMQDTLDSTSHDLAISSPR